MHAITAKLCVCCFLCRDDFERACDLYPAAAKQMQSFAASRYEALLQRMDVEERFRTMDCGLTDVHCACIVLMPGVMDLDGNNELSKSELQAWIKFMGIEIDDSKVPTFAD